MPRSTCFPMRLLLFDIDGTLVDTRGAGLGALLDAVEEVLEVSREVVPPLDLAGATDGGVIRTLFAQFGRPDHPAARQTYIGNYLRHLERRLHDDLFAGVALPGVSELLQALAAVPDVALGLLTGNVRAGAETKLKRFNLHGFFRNGAFGDDAEDRNLLGPVAVKRFEAALGRDIKPEQVIVIGDTVRDVDCAAALGARCLAVATGTHDRQRLEGSSPRHCLDDLRDTARVLDLLTA